MIEPKVSKLKNGLRLVTAENPAVESVTVMVGVGAGSRYETSKTSGAFHFLEHLAFKGTKSRPSTKVIAEAIDGVGGEFNAFTSKELTAYYIKLAAKHLSLALDILADILQNSLFRPEDIEKERGVITEEINMYADTPMRQVAEDLVRLLYGDNPMGWSVAGDKKSVANISREDLLDYLKRLYYPEKMVVAVAGKSNAKALREKVEDNFLALKTRTPKPLNSQTTPKSFPNLIQTDQSSSNIHLSTKNTEQTHFCLGVPGYSLKDPKRFALMVLATVLGGSMSSRLYLALVDRLGLAYYAAAHPDFYTDSGYLMARAGVKLSRTEEALKVTLALFDELRQKEVAEEELTKAKEFLKGRLILEQEETENVANRGLSQELLEGKIRPLSETIAKIDAVSAAEVRTAARELMARDKLRLALIGPQKEEGLFTRLLK